MFWERFYKLCKDLNIKPNPLGKQLGISSGIITKWKNGSIPNGETLIKIADYLDCSIDYLLGRTDFKDIQKKSLKTEEEKEENNEKNKNFEIIAAYGGNVNNDNTANELKKEILTTLMAANLDTRQLKEILGIIKLFDDTI